MSEKIYRVTVLVTTDIPALNENEAMSNAIERVKALVRHPLGSRVTGIAHDGSEYLCFEQVEI